MKRHASTLLLIVIFLIGLSLLLYPSFSDWWNSFHQSRAVASYVGTVANLDNEKYQRMWDEAQAYNGELAEKSMNLQLTEEEAAAYDKLLDVSGTGIMGYVDIPKIKVTLPVYHGTDEAVLQVAVGHIAGTSLPVGGESSHCVISGHRGLPRARLFTDIDRLVVGDTFTLNVLDNVLTYEVDQIRIVLPEEVENLAIEEGKDYCTLVTCTPYGINSHRLLVRGHRIETKASSIRVTADALQVENTTVAVCLAVPMLLALAIIVLVSTGIRKRKRKQQDSRTDER